MDAPSRKFINTMAIMIMNARPNTFAISVNQNRPSLELFSIISSYSSDPTSTVIKINPIIPADYII